MQVYELIHQLTIGLGFRHGDWVAKKIAWNWNDNELLREHYDTLLSIGLLEEYAMPIRLNLHPDIHRIVDVNYDGCYIIITCR